MNCCPIGYGEKDEVITMKKLFINPASEIKYFLKMFDEYYDSRETMMHSIPVGDAGRCVDLSITHRPKDAYNPRYIYGEAHFLCKRKILPPIEWNEETVSFLSDFIVDFYKEATKNTIFYDNGISVTVDTE